MQNKSWWYRLTHIHIHWHKFVMTRGCNNYYECRCGHRVVGCYGGGYTPIDVEWLRGEEWATFPSKAPANETGVH